MEVGISLFENRKHEGYSEVVKGDRKEKEKSKKNVRKRESNNERKKES